MKRGLLLAAIVLASIAPFASRAVFVDENIFLYLAESALERPLFPADIPAVFFGVERPNYSGHTHPPAGEYYLALLYAWTGRFDEATFRLLFAVFPILAVLSFHDLAARFTAQPLLVAILFAVSPAFLVLAPSLLMDVPMLAFLLAGLALYFRGRLVPAGAAFTLAAGTGYTALIPIACLAAVMAVSRRPAREWACIAAAPAILLAWLAAMSVHFGAFPLRETAAYFLFQGWTRPPEGLLRLRAHSVLMNTAAVFAFAGSILVFPGAVVSKRARTAAGCAGAAGLLSLTAQWPSLPHRLWFTLLAASGLMILSGFAREVRKLVGSREGSRGEAVLILWAPAVLAFFVVVGDMINARYMLLAAPPLLLVLFRESTRARLAAAIAASAVLSLALAISDSRFVNSYRAWVDSTVPPLQAAGFRIYGAAESGLRFYLEGKGAPTLSQKDLRPAGSDILVRQDLFRYGLAEDVEVVTTVIGRFPLEDALPLRTFSRDAGAGFYDSRLGLVPFSFSRAAYDVIELSQVNPLVRRLPQTSTNPEEAPVWSPDGPIYRQTDAERVFPMRIPSDIQIQYELEGGTGRAERTADGLRLVNSGAGPLTWRRLRFMPLGLMERAH